MLLLAVEHGQNQKRQAAHQKTMASNGGDNELGDALHAIENSTQQMSLTEPESGIASTEPSPMGASDTEVLKHEILELREALASLISKKDQEQTPSASEVAQKASIMQEKMEQLVDTLKAPMDRVLNLATTFERENRALHTKLSELELQLQANSAGTYNGRFLWRIPEIKRRWNDAKSGRVTSLYSPPFYTGRNGYKLCIRTYLNGDGVGFGTHVSIFIVLMKGEYDNLMTWPFIHKVSLVIIDQDQKKHIVFVFKPSATSLSFQKPIDDMNTASGVPRFAETSILTNSETGYVKDDVMFIQAIIDTSKIIHP